LKEASTRKEYIEDRFTGKFLRGYHSLSC